VYTGKREQPCCLCDDPETAHRLDLPPRAIEAMARSGRISWRDVVGEVSIYFCESDWETVCDLVLDVGMNPIGKCNAARADFDLREDFEALTNAVRDREDHAARERDRLARARETLAAVEAGEAVETREIVEARVVTWTLEDLGVTAPQES
jgi:predicted transcriptional regulator